MISLHILLNSGWAKVPIVLWLKNLFLKHLKILTEFISACDRMQQFWRILAAKVISMSVRWIGFAAVYLQWQRCLHTHDKVLFSTKSVNHCDLFMTCLSARLCYLCSELHQCNMSLPQSIGETMCEEQVCYSRSLEMLQIFFLKTLFQFDFVEQAWQLLQMPI